MRRGFTFQHAVLHLFFRVEEAILRLPLFFADGIRLKIQIIEEIVTGFVTNLGHLS
ncbi:hypothetical protein NEOCIP111885_00522 [Pseudoneobacillus rhizosphaerae]|uniref:Uncharacterized protein n=1 Tax=Pseudoneobacillus rhizosphaerae TaxID=2880968 RepID=A0A9C7G6E3_9BACI|nr:hypothetical protein NEOCIP111885_00522 [Pseudoneobacillus rhizosphaerae]